MNRTFLKPVIQYLPLAVIVVDKERKVLLANKTAEVISRKTELDLLGLKGGEALGCVFSKSHSDGCGYAQQCELCAIKNGVIEAFAETKSIQLNDIVMTFEELGKRNLRVSISYLNLDKINNNPNNEERRLAVGRRKYDKHKEVAVVAMEDITDFKKKEKLDATFEVVGAICHEMNQPLQTVLGYSDLLISETDPVKIKEKVLILKGQIERLGTLTKQLQGIKKYETRKYLEREILDITKSAE